MSNGLLKDTPVALMVFAAVFGNSYLVVEPVTTECRRGLSAWQMRQAKRSSLVHDHDHDHDHDHANESDFFSSRSLLGNPLKPKADSHLVALTGSWRHGTRDHHAPLKGDQHPGVPQSGHGGALSLSLRLAPATPETASLAASVSAGHSTLKSIEEPLARALVTRLQSRWNTSSNTSGSSNGSGNGSSNGSSNGSNNGSGNACW
jgi:hypothetical protein